jgi:AraC-like DNA-binding protein
VQYTIFFSVFHPEPWLIGIFVAMINLLRQLFLPFCAVIVISATAFKENPLPVTSTHELLKLGNHYLEKKDTETAIRYYHQLLPALITSGDNLNLGLVYIKLARIAKARHKYSDLFTLGQKSLEYYEKANERRRSMDVLNFLGVAYADIGCTDKSLQFQLRALKIAEELEDYLGMSIMLVNISGMKGPDHAIEFLNQAMDAIKNVKDDTAKGYVLNTMGLYFLGINRYDSALYFFKIALATREHVKEYQGISFTLNNIGEVYFREKKMAEALKYYNKGLAVAASIEDPLSLCVAYGSLATYYNENGNTHLALPMMKKNLELARLLQFKEQEIKALSNLATHYEAANNPREALKYFRQYNALKDTLFEEKRQRTVTEIQTQYDLAAKEKAIFKLQSENKINNLEIQRDRAIIASMAVLVIIIFTGAWLIIRSYRQKLNAYKELVRRDIENIRAELEREDIALPAIRKKGSAVAPITRSMSQTVITDELQEALYTGLLHLMKTEKRFLDTTLTLADVAKELNTNTSYLSRIINARASQNFSQFINDYRIHEARRLLADSGFSNLSIEGIAQTVGFKSKSAFNTAFKNKTGVTPSFYQQSAKSMAASGTSSGLGKT